MKLKELTLGNNSMQVVNVDTPPTLIRRGVLSMVTKQGMLQEVVVKPIYIVEYAEEVGGVDLVSVFGLKANSKMPEKDYEVIIQKQGFKTTTFLGDLASKVKGKDLPEKKVIRTKPPLFIAPVVTGVNTFTGKTELGFYEREKDRFITTATGAGIEYGENTGVFVGLSSVKWEKTFVNAGDTVQSFVADKLLWFDLVSPDIPQFKSETHD